MAIATAAKTVSHKLPYTGATFQHLTDLLIGRDGYISGGSCQDDGTEVTLQSFTFVQRGIIAEATGAALAIPAELIFLGVLIEPAFVVAGVNDDNPTSGVTVTVTGSLEAASSAVVIAFKAGGAWQNPVPVNLLGPAMRAAELGPESGLNGRIVVAGGEVTGISLERGELVDPDGVRRRLARLASSTAKALDLFPVGPDVANGRTDFIVRRRVDENVAEVRHLLGSLRGQDSAVALQTTSNVCRPHYFARRGGTLDQQWWAWGAGGPPSDLRIQGGPAGEAFAATTLLVAAGSISETWVVGQRAADDAVIVLYRDGTTLLRMVSFDPGTGAVVDAAVTLINDTNAMSYLRAALVANDQFHLVYCRQEGGNGEIYYAKFSFAASTFGASAISPRYVEGAAEGQVSLWPDVAADRYGRAHICWITGTSGTDGDLKYLVIGPNGANDGEVQQFVPASAVGTTDTSVLADPAAGENGFVAESFDAFQSCHVAVTSHDEVFIALLGESTAGSPDNDHVLLFHSAFEDRTGFPLLSVATMAGIFEAGLTPANWPLRSLDLAVGEQGQLVVGVISIDPLGTDTRHQFFTFNTEPFRYGFFEDRDLLAARNTVIVADAGGFDDLMLEVGARGGMVFLTRSGTAGAVVARTQQFGPLQRTSTDPFRPQVDPHPKDEVLLSWEVAADAGEDLQGDGGNFALVHARLKKMNYPFLVGDRGDYQGHESIRGAIAAAAKQGGGEIVIRAGHHQIETSSTRHLLIPSGVSLRGENNAYLEFSSGYGLTVSGGGEVTVGDAVSGNIVSLPAAGFQLVGTMPRVGDLIDLAGGGSGLHTIRAVLTPSGTDLRFYVDDNINGVPTLGTATYHYAAGTRLENLTIRGYLVSASQQLIRFTQVYQGALRNLRFEGGMEAPATQAVICDSCPGLLVDGLDFRNFAAADATMVLLNLLTSADLSAGDSAILRGIRSVDGKGITLIGDSALNVWLVDCSSDGSDPAENVYEIGAGRTTPVFMINTSGRVTGETESLVTQVSKLVPANGDALVTEDPVQLRSRDYYDDLGLQTQVDRAGLLAQLGEYFFEDFQLNPLGGLLGELWTTSTPGTSAITWTSPHRVALDSGTTGDSCDLQTVLNIHGPWTNKPLFRARASFLVCDEGGNSGRVGMGSNLGAGLAAYFIQSSAIAADSQLHFVVTNDSDVEYDHPTGFTPVDGTMYWLWIVWKGTTQVSWAISTDISSDPVAGGVATVGAGVVRTGDLFPFFSSAHGGAAESTCFLTVDTVEVATTTRTP